jgi:hypothetical protein
MNLRLLGGKIMFIHKKKEGESIEEKVTDVLMWNI